MDSVSNIQVNDYVITLFCFDLILSTYIFNKYKISVTGILYSFSLFLVFLILSILITYSIQGYIQVFIIFL